MVLVVAMIWWHTLFQPQNHTKQTWNTNQKTDDRDQTCQYVGGGGREQIASLAIVTYVIVLFHQTIAEAKDNAKKDALQSEMNEWLFDW